MKNILTLIAIVLLLGGLILSTFTVQEYQQALVLQLGKISGSPVTKAGLHWKIPFIQEIKYFEKRIMHWDGNPTEVPTADKKFVWVDTTARWRIKDALQFYKSVRDTQNAIFRMGPILNGATKDTVSSFNLTESVRNSNSIFKDFEDNLKDEITLGSDLELSLKDVDIEKIAHGREKLAAMIAERAGRELKNLGIELIDIQFRSIGYQKSVEEKVYQSMIAERSQVATKIRSSGKGERAKILGQLDLALKKIESEAYRKAQVIRGTAEANAIEVYANTLKEDPGLFQFLKTLETYKNTIAKNGEFILSSDNAFLNLLNKGQ